MQIDYVQKGESNMCWLGCGKTVTIIYCKWECDKSDGFSVNYGVRYDLAIPLLTMDSREINIHGSVIYLAEKVETTQISVNSWMDKQNVVHLDNEILLDH